MLNFNLCDLIQQQQKKTKQLLYLLYKTSNILLLCFLILSFFSEFSYIIASQFDAKSKIKKKHQDSEAR